MPKGPDMVDGYSLGHTDATEDSKKPKDIVEQLREFKEAIKPKPPTTNG